MGVVSAAAEVSTTKTALRAATFSLKKLPPQTAVQSLSPAYTKTAETLAQYYATSVGSVLFALLAPEIRNGTIPLPYTHHTTEVRTPTPPELLQGTQDERHVAYRSLVRETFAHSGSVLCVVPTSIEAETMQHALSAGIEDRVILLTSTMTKRNMQAAYRALEDFSKSKLIIATPSHAVLDRHDITTVIIEHARSPYFKARTKPYLDYRTVLTTHARHTGRRLIMGDILLRSEEEYLRREDTYHTYGETPKRIALPGTLTPITLTDTPSTDTPFRLFSPEVLEAIAQTRSAKRQTFLFTAHRGLAPVVACIDCGYIFRSPETGAPYSLVRTTKNGTEERWFVCSTSGSRKRAADVCPECTSWRLRERGIGIQYVHDELAKTLKNTPVILFDHTTASTFKKACFLRDKFYATKGAIMLGTHMAIPYLTQPITTSVIVSMDALYATPTWRLQEENLAFLLRLREQTTGTVYLQTRTTTDDLIRHAQQGATELFYTEELELRKTFNYPPFTTFIHLTWQGDRAAIDRIEQLIQQTFTDTNLSIYNAPPSPKGVHTRYGLLRVASIDWPDARIRTALLTLPPSVRVVINPDRII